MPLPSLEHDLIGLGLRTPAALTARLRGCEEDDLLGRLERLGLSSAERSALAKERRGLPLGPATEDLAFEVWARRQGIASEVVSEARRLVGEGARFWEYLLAQEVLDLEHTPLVGRGTFTCPGCASELPVETSLITEVPCCLVCGWLRDELGETTPSALRALGSGVVELGVELGVEETAPGSGPLRVVREATLAEESTSADDAGEAEQTLSPARAQRSSDRQPTQVEIAPRRGTLDSGEETLGPGEETFAPGEETYVPGLAESSATLALERSAALDGEQTYLADEETSGAVGDDAPTLAPERPELSEETYDPAPSRATCDSDPLSGEAAPTAAGERGSEFAEATWSGGAAPEELSEHTNFGQAEDSRGLTFWSPRDAQASTPSPAPAVSPREPQAQRPFEPTAFVPGAGALATADEQLVVANAVLREWAATQGLDAAQVAQLEASESPAEVLIQHNWLPVDRLFEALEGETRVGCGSCELGYLLGREVSPLAVLVPCPRCGGTLGVAAGATVMLSGPEAQAQAQLAVAGAGEVERIGPYRLVSLLGKGGMGEVYQALDEQNQLVALKVLKAKLGAKSDHRRRFEREGRALARLDHPNVVRLLDQGVDPESERAYLALELVPGLDLAKRLHERGQLAHSEALFVVHEVAVALEAAHAAGLLHRDIKPGNVLLTPQGEVKVTDFGVALEEDVSLRLTAAGAVLGTPQYIAPEAIRGEDWGAPVDVYALGCTAFKILSGRLPFVHRTLIDLLDAHQEEAPPSLAELVPGLDAGVAALLQRTLAKDPDLRPTCAELRAGLAAHLPRRADLVGLWGEQAEATVVQRGPAPSGAESLPSESYGTLATGQIFHHFLLKDELGRGGMGVVYLAQHLRLKKAVAVKVMLSGALAGEDEKRRFLREAESAAALSHPYVVGVLDSGEWEGNLYLAMEYFEGLPLQRYYQAHTEREPLLRLFLKVCEGVHHAHSRGVIHRDLKPDNILVDADGDPHVLDFGIAKRLDAPEEEVEGTIANLTTAGDIMGTLRYMPPEQAAGRANEVDVRSDVYTLGGILYELVTSGLTPFKGNVGQMLHKIMHEEPLPPSKRTEQEVPWELDAICLKALAKDSEQRYQSVRELRLDVERYLDGLPIVAKRATALYRFRKWLGRNRGRVAAGLAALALVSSVLGLWLADRVATQARRQEALLGAARSAWSQAAEGRYREASESFELARSRLETGEVLALPEDLQAAIPGEYAASYVDRTLLERWKGFATERVRLEEAHVQVAAGEAALERHDPSSATSSLTAAEALAPDDARVRRLRGALGDALRADGAAELEAARLSFDPAQRSSSLEHASHLLERAQSLGDKQAPALLRELDRVAESVKRAEEETRARAEAEVHLGRARERGAEASARLAAAVGAEPIALSAARQEARAALRAGERELILALAALPRYAPAEEEKTRVHLRLAELALASEEFGQAEQALIDARLYNHLEAEVAAVASRVAAVDLQAQAFKLQVERGDVAFERGDYPVAERAYALALAQRADVDVERRRQLCGALAQAERAREARNLRREQEALSLAQRLDPRDARIPARLEDLRRALFQEAFLAAQGTLADAVQTGEGFERAISAFEAALALEPRDRDAQRGRVDAYALRDRPPGRVLISVPLERLLSGSAAARAGEVVRFYIDRTEVTRAAYAEFVADRGYHKEAYWSPVGWAAREQLRDQTGRRAPAGWVDAKPPPGTDALPVTGVCYFEAEAYARWRGVRLPTDREWRLSACFDPQLGRFRQNPWPEGVSLTPAAHLREAGSDPRDESPFGVLDLGFNASEWVQPEGAPTGPSGRAFVRGLSTRAFPYDLAQGVDAWRKSPRATFRDETISFRCVEDVPTPPVYAPEGSR